MTSLTVDAEVADLDAIMELEHSGFPADEQWSRAGWESELSNQSLQVLAVRDDQPSRDQLLGVIALRFGGDVCDLDRIVVDPRHRRHGIGRGLLAAGLARAAVAGAREMILEVRSDNTPAIMLYKAYGFTRIAARNDYYGPGRHAMIMRRAVGDSDA